MRGAIPPFTRTSVWPFTFIIRRWTEGRGEGVLNHFKTLLLSATAERNREKFEKVLISNRALPQCKSGTLRWNEPATEV
jgi:hypothetical protein